ncbi:MAG: 16S rRNA (guanine(527)-N(7))-methyltransferase RsmG [Clostridia bacterium]|nr:16S rRNA (guanine(527)-N(7))-methyltransferase RsmG [Clostridia bacterium]
MDYEPLNQEKLQRMAAVFHVKLDETALKRFAIYARLLQSWNEKINLTAITATDDILVKHFADSLTVLPLLSLPQGASLIDVGTGAGLPGLALLIARPDLRVTLLDSTKKKLGVIEDICAQLELSPTLLHARAEEAGHDAALRERFDAATARAVANLRELAEYCLPFVRVGGVFAAMKSANADAELEQAKPALKILHASVAQVQTFSLEDAGTRTILLLKKNAPLSVKYPRPSAKIAKNPLK